MFFTKIIIFYKHILLLVILFDQVDTSQKIYTDVDYGPLINELNVLSSKYSNLFAIREGVNKRKREKAKEAKENEFKGKPASTEANPKVIDMNAQPKAVDTLPIANSNNTTENADNKIETTDNSENNKYKKLKPDKPPPNVKKVLKPKRGRGKKR